MLTVDKQLTNDVIAFGGDGIKECYQCGACTATCPLSEDGIVPARRLIKYVQLGLKDRVINDLTPWLCYYCGECSTDCPKEAKPGEIMASLRRYITAHYDLTGLSMKIYRSKATEILILTALSLVLLVPIALFHGPINLDHVDLFSFLPLQTLDLVGLTVGGVIGLIMLGNLVNMGIKTRQALGPPVSPGGGGAGFVSGFFSTLITEVVAQKRNWSCANRNRPVAHLALFWGFVGLLIATSLLFGKDILGLSILAPEINILGLKILVPKILGLVSGVALTYGSVYYIYKRIKKDEEAMTVSHFTDWSFLILLFLTGVTGYLVDIFEYFSMPLPTYIAFIVHLVVAFDLLVLIPFSKFAHAIFRPFALYFTIIRTGRLPARGD